VNIRNEVKIGLAVILATIVFYAGIRYFRDLPIWGQATIYHAELPNSKGLVTGNVVAVNGVAVGSVTGVRLISTGAQVTFSVHDDVVLTEGSTASSGGFGIVSSVQLNLVLGPPDAPVYPPGSLIPASTDSDILSDLADRAPGVIDQVDTFLSGSNSAIDAATELLTNPEGQMKQTLASIEASARALESVLLADQGGVQSALEEIENLSETLETFAGDSLGSVTTDVKLVMRQLSTNLMILESSIMELNALLTSINSGQGTLGKLAQDDSLYVELLGTTSALKKILQDFEENPKKYLEHLRLVDVF